MLLALLIALAPAVQEGDAQAFTSLSDLEGKPLADGRYAQEVKDGRLHIEARYDFSDGRVVVERAVLRLHPQIEQESWDWTERKGGAGFAGDGRRPQAGASEAALLRSYEVDLRTGKAVATRMDEKKRWRDDVDVEPGKTFAGIGFIVAVKSLCDQLAPGQKTELKAIAFTPRPRSATVSIIHGGRETVRMAGRSVRADRFDIHPEIPAIARLFVHVPDQHIWLVGEGPPAFLRYEGPLVEPGDPVIRVDLIPGPSAHAQPRARQAPRR